MRCPAFPFTDLRRRPVTKAGTAPIARDGDHIAAIGLRPVQSSAVHSRFSRASAKTKSWRSSEPFSLSLSRRTNRSATFASGGGQRSSCFLILSVRVPEMVVDRRDWYRSAAFRRYSRNQQTYVAMCRPGYASYQISQRWEKIGETAVSSIRSRLRSVT
jgi:hypothetical protein